jgi:hypothetical protein
MLELASASMELSFSTSLWKLSVQKLVRLTFGSGVKSEEPRLITISLKWLQMPLVMVRMTLKMRELETVKHQDQELTHLLTLLPTPLSQESGPNFLTWAPMI